MAVDEFYGPRLSSVLMGGTARDVVKQADDAGLRLVRFLWCGNDGTVRAKASAIGGLEGRLSSGIGLTVAMQAMNGLDQLQPVDGMGPVGEIRLVPDLDTFRVLPYAPRAGAMLVDLVTLDGEPAPQCPRSFLQRMTALLAGRGARLEVAFENEFSLAVVAEGGFTPIDSSLCFSTIGMTAAQAYIDTLVDAFDAQGITFEQYYAELGHGQQEISTAHAPALRAADEQILVRETIRGVAAQHGLVASLAPKPWPEGAGNGCHILASTNLELKAADASCNPYLALGGLIAAGLDGLDRALAVPAPVEVDPATIPEDERTRRGILRLPATQADALDALEVDSVLMDALGLTLARSYLSVRRSEWAAYSAGDEAFEQQGHFEKY